MANVVFTPQQWAGKVKGMVSKFMPAAERGLYEGAMGQKPELYRQTRKAPPANPKGIGHGGAVDTASYLASWQIRKIRLGVEVVNKIPYAGIIEDGRSPGRMPP